MKNLLIASAATLALSASSAFAAELPLKAAPAAPAYSWTGCYVDAGVGYEMWNQDHYFVDFPTLTALGPTTTTGGRGWLGRFGGGCDYQVAPHWVIGAFADFDAKSLSSTFDDPVTGFFGPERETGSWAAGGRIGYSWAPGVLSFADGGFTQARFSSVPLSVSFVPGFPPSGVTQPAQTYDGWFLGAGNEVALADWFAGLPSGLFLKTEYRYSSYNAENIEWVVTATGAPAGIGEHSTKYEQSVTTSLEWRFNWMH